MLWQRSLVMRDLETQSLWSHLLGTAMQGKMKGSALEILPASMTTWGEWKQRHPQTTLLALPRTAKRFTESVWKNPAAFIYGITPHAGTEPIAVAMPLLQKQKLIQAKDKGEFYLFTFSDKGKRAQAFSRVLDDKKSSPPLVFQLSQEKGSMRDTLTQSTWDIVTGECTKGQLEGKQLKLLPGTVSFKRAWETFFPDGTMVK